MALVWVWMAGRAAPIGKSEKRRGVRRGTGRLVAAAAHDRHMCSSQRETRLLVQRERKGRRMKAVHAVASLATAEEGLRVELAIMNVAVAVPALIVWQAVLHHLLSAHVALVALHLAVLPQERIGSGLMAVQRERGWCEAGFRMAEGTIAAICLVPELASMRVIRGVAIEALRMSQRTRKIRVPVARGASNSGVLSRERKPRARMVKAGQPGNLLPSAGGVAGLAGAPKGSAMRVLVAGRAGVKPQPGILRNRGGAGGPVALFAQSFLVQTRQRKACLGVVKAGSLFPGVERVAVQTVASQLAAMRIRVAAEAILRKSQKGAAGVFHREGAQFLGGNEFFFMASRAFDGRMSSLQRVAGFPVIKRFFAAGPSYDREVPPNMIGVAADAVLRRLRSVHYSGMITAPACQPLPDLLVAVQALELRCAGTDGVTAGALAQ
ncbi:MAG TPA: hypothetical protein VNN17_02315 [Terriglobia bacterium]|nr:hypothetical protein [Terriglobia bacterium]